MKIIKEQPLKDFEFWSGARYVADYLTEEEFEAIEESLEEYNPNGLTATEINDLFWFDVDYIASVLGYENEDELWKNLIVGRLNKAKRDSERR